MSADRDAIISNLLQTLDSCSQLIESPDYRNSERAVSELVNSLDSIANSIAAEFDADESEKSAIDILGQIDQYLCLRSLNQDFVDAWAFELPKLVAKFGCVSRRCSEVAEKVICLFVHRCNPRVMFIIFYVALDSPTELFMIPGYFIPLLGGLTKVLVLIQMQIYEQVYAAVSVVLNVLKSLASKSDYEDIVCAELFYSAIGLANSIRALDDKDGHKLRALLALYILQFMALVSVGMRSAISSRIPLVIKLSDELQQCKLSYIGLITGSEVDEISKLVMEDNGNDSISCFSGVKLGASVAVIWGYMNSEVAIAAKADLTAVTLELQGNRASRWQALAMLKNVFSCANLPSALADLTAVTLELQGNRASRWQALAMLKNVFSCANLPSALKRHAIGFVLCVMDGSASHSCDDHLDYTAYMPSLYTSLQAIKLVIMYGPDPMTQMNALSTLKKVLLDIPASQRFDILRNLVKSSDSSSMVALLLDCVREEMHMEKNDRNKCMYFWSPSVIELVEVVLRPPKGGAPALPEDNAAVLSALNFYRYLLITESTGKSNYTGILSKDHLHKAFNEWLLPLRPLVSAVAAENRNGCDRHLLYDAICALNLVELVLYRCIELVEEELKHV
ncbi:aberrant root formation protein 4-like isoform X1 [Primulina huaijiensis]|uniref:aberrant root formation protein 4-like isoform X1 n=1 Tax=Primulina huaijiensis TaxID=1492673 RepID=UPI003CC727AF